MNKPCAPFPTFINVMDDAQFWASIAPRSELKAYALASYQALSIDDRLSFLEYLREQA
jgi:hypothetical protein